MTTTQKNTRRVRATSTPDDGVERDAEGVPTAIRLWRAGDNATDYGVHRFTTESARLLVEQQRTRGNRYSFDINHASLDKSAPLENQRAMGSFAIEVRRGECWAVDCRFTAEMRKQLAAGEWLSISPAYDVRPDGVIVNLLNCAVTSSPATWNAARIAASRTNSSVTQTLPVNVLRAQARGTDRELASTACRELARRGESISGDPRIEQMRTTWGIGPSRPLVRHERGVHQVFGYATPEDAREHLRAMATRPRPVFASKAGVMLHARMTGAAAPVRARPTEQVLPPMTPEEARVVLAKKGHR